MPHPLGHFSRVKYSVTLHQQQMERSAANYPLAGKKLKGEIRNLEKQALRALSQH